MGPEVRHKQNILAALCWFYVVALFFFGLVLANPAFIKIFSLDGAICLPTLKRLHYIQAAFLVAGIICGLVAMRLSRKTPASDVPQWVVDIVFPLTFLIFLLFSIEGLLAVRFYPSYLPSDMDEPLALKDKDLGYRLNPSHDDIYKINKRGFRGREPVLDGTKKNIYCVGDSITFGIELTDESMPYPERLQQILLDNGFTGLNVVNAGAPGYASLNALRYIKSDIIPSCPGLIILCVGQNDLHESLWGDWRPDGVNQYVVTRRKPLAILEFVKFLSQRLRPGKKGGAHYEVSDRVRVNARAQEAALAQFRSDLVQIIDVCRRQGVPLLILNIPTIISDQGMTDAERTKAGAFTADFLRPFQKTIEDVCRQNNVAAQLAVFNLDETSKSDYFWDHCHLTPKGTSEMAKRVYAAMIRYYPKLLEK